MRIGFRRIEIKKRKLLINGQPVRIHGVNRHESNPRTGRTLTREDMVRDLTLMRRFNINAIRTSHYPDDPAFYDLPLTLRTAVPETWTGDVLVRQGDREAHISVDTATHTVQYDAVPGAEPITLQPAS